MGARERDISLYQQLKWRQEYKNMGKSMIDNRIYNDSWFFSLSQTAKWLFIFLITNHSCNLIGCYEVPEQILSSYTGISIKDLKKHCTELKDKVLFIDNWIIIKNYQKYNPMRNPSIEKSKQGQLNSLPSNIRKIYDTLYTPSIQGVDTLQGKETERKGVGNGIGKETEVRGEGYKKFKDISNQLKGKLSSI